MKLIAIFVILLTLPAYAVRHVLPQLPEGDGSGREASTNAVILVGAVDAGRFGLSLELNAETNNNVTVEFGVDGDDDGALSRNEVDVALGWACGQWFFNNRQSNVLIAKDMTSGCRKSTWTISLTPERSAKRLVVMDGASLVFNAPVPTAAFNPAWNLVRVVRRGVADVDEVATYSLFNEPFRVIVR